MTQLKKISFFLIIFFHISAQATNISDALVNVLAVSCEIEKRCNEEDLSQKDQQVLQFLGEDLHLCDMLEAEGVDVQKVINEYKSNVKKSCLK